MGYCLSQNTGECVQLPAVVLDRLTQATEGAVRTVISAIERTASADAAPHAKDGGLK